jgi:hypothetical protein
MIDPRWMWQRLAQHARELGKEGGSANDSTTG